MTLGSKIKEERLRLNLTQEELGKKINLSKANISKYEKNTLEPNIDTMKMLSAIFDVSTDYLLGISNERNPKEDLGIVTKAFHLAEDVDELPQEALDQIDEYIRLLKLKHKK